MRVKTWRNFLVAALNARLFGLLAYLLTAASAVVHSRVTLVLAVLTVFMYPLYHGGCQKGYCLTPLFPSGTVGRNG